MLELSGIGITVVLSGHVKECYAFHSYMSSLLFQGSLLGLIFGKISPTCER